MKTKRVKAFTIDEGDVIAIEMPTKGQGKLFRAHTITRVAEIDEDYISFDYKEGGFGLYGRRNLVTKVIEK